MIEEGKYKELTGKIIGCAMEVHNQLGAGFQEKIYHRALEREMRSAGVELIREFEMDIYYKEEIIGSRRVDFLVEQKISVEIKAVSLLEPIHLNQALNYLEVYNLEIGLLLNFGSKRLEIKRLVNPKYKLSKK